MGSLKVAFLYQANLPPVIDGVNKPMKKGGYSDSGADMAFALVKAGVPVITPVVNPKEPDDFDWVFPDTPEGIEEALQKGADTLWLNTVLYEGHPIEQYLDRAWVVGQVPADVGRYDDKYSLNRFLAEQGIRTAPQTAVVQAEDYRGSYPAVLKPIRGRGSQGVTVVDSTEELAAALQRALDAKIYGNRMMAEPFLPGTEVTFSILPAGDYLINGEAVRKEGHWYLPPVERFTHENRIAPYNGVVPVAENSRVIPEDAALREIGEQCARVGDLLSTRAVIRIDCRQDENGDYSIFDVNFKPNMTGASRSHRMDQDSLIMLAARAIGWDFPGLVQNLLAGRWTGTVK